MNTVPFQVTAVSIALSNRFQAPSNKISKRMRRQSLQRASFRIRTWPEEMMLRIRPKKPIHASVAITFFPENGRRYEPNERSRERDGPLGRRRNAGDDALVEIKGFETPDYRLKKKLIEAVWLVAHPGSPPSCAG